MQLISIGNAIVNLDRGSALDFDRLENGVQVLRVLTDSEKPIMIVSLTEEVPDILLNLVPQKMRFVGYEAPKAAA
jgi:hypothetical protein